jgi:hypothetical protein
MESGTLMILNLLLEPTVLPSAFLALCSTIILHRFASPAWWEHLKKHISAKMSSEDAFDRVVTLKVGDKLSRVMADS